VSVVTQATPPVSPSGDIHASADHRSVERWAPVPQVASVHG
jgi:hypothetical protein